jgi:hypothetical protein
MLLNNAERSVCEAALALLKSTEVKGEEVMKPRRVVCDFAYQRGTTVIEVARATGFDAPTVAAIEARAQNIAFENSV